MNGEKPITLEILPEEFVICQIGSAAEADLSQSFTFLSRTDEELSLVCPREAAPCLPLKMEAGYRCLRIQGVLDFSLVGILSGIAACLAERKIPLFALSTFNTDYILVKENHLPGARAALEEKGYQMTEGA